MKSNTESEQMITERLPLKKHKKVCIISGGDVNQEFLLKLLKEEECEQIICVDGGLKHAYELNLKVDYIVGDFDTIDHVIIRHYKDETSVPIREYNPVKDSTDTDIALSLALSAEPEAVYIVGGIGSRMDHTLGNIHILKKTLSSNSNTYLINEHNRISMLSHSVVLEKRKMFGDYISFIPFTEKIENLTLKGFKYPLENCTMVNGESLGISNEIVDETAYVEFQKGILLMIEARD